MPNILMVRLFRLLEIASMKYDPTGV